MTFWQGRRVLVTGHTGFKGSWLCEWLLGLGAEVRGLALAARADQPLFDQLRLGSRVNGTTGDIRDAGVVRRAVAAVRPEIVFHLAAQPLVLASYDDPLGTWATNVMGSAHVMEAVRALDAPCAVVMVTTDKVYENREWRHPYREGDRLGGHDPYSASKAAMEIAISSWRRAFLGDGRVPIASARAGNVIGGGDWAEHRIVPDIVRALRNGQAVRVRHPDAVRPFQHVMEPLSGYLRLARALVENPASMASAYNFGPEPADLKTVRQLVEMALEIWPGTWHDDSDGAARHEAGLLSLGIEAARADLGYAPRWDSARALAETISWYRADAEGADPVALTRAQIAAFGAP